MRFVDVIARKRDGHALSPDEIARFVRGVTDGSIPDYQASALLMAVVLRGMTADETASLTDAMVRSGDRVDLSDVPGRSVGKHSTGGVGDKVSIVLAPLAAACGVIVPKMSGRGLGHTGGTLDKLESIPGFRTDLSIEQFKRVLRSVGTCIIGQTRTLAPADKKLYALRDVTATVESIPLIAASIMSKKLAEGSSALVLDVKCGDGAFMKTVEDARALAQAMVAIGTRAGVPTEAFITTMDAPLGRAVGNALEIRECVELLGGSGPADLSEVAQQLAARMIVAAGVEPHMQAAAARAREALMSRSALRTFQRLIEQQGGDPRIVDDPSRLPQAAERMEMRAPHPGYVSAMRAELIGRASSMLGAGRARVGDPVNHAVGIVLRVKPGDAVQRDQPVLELHHDGGRGLEDACALCEQAVVIGDQPPAAVPSILAEIR